MKPKVAIGQNLGQYLVEENYEVIIEKNLELSANTRSSPSRGLNSCWLMRPCGTICMESKQLSSKLL